MHGSDLRQNIQWRVYEYEIIVLGQIRVFCLAFTIPSHYLAEESRSGTCNVLRGVRSLIQFFFTKNE